MDVDAGHGAALGRAFPTPASELTLTQRVRSFLSFQGRDDDPVTVLTRTHRGIHPSADAAVLRRSYAIAAFLSGSTASETQRAALFADLGRTAVRSVG